MSVSKYLSVGLREEYARNIKDKIVLSNGIAYYFIFLSFIYIGVALWLVPLILPYAILLIFINLGALGLMHFGYHVPARFLIATGPSIISFFIDISAMRVGETGTAGSYMIQLSLCILPWIIFDFTEKVLLWGTFLFCVLSILLIDPLNGLIEPAVESEEPLKLLKAWETQLLFFITSAGIVAGCLYIMLRINAKTELKNQQLIAEAESKHQDLLANELKLNNYIAEIEKNRKEDQQREWMSLGIAKFAEILRMHGDDLQLMYDTLMRTLVNYLQANQGGLYIVEQDGNEKYLELKACYAYERKKYIDKRIEVGEGLVGQTYLERDLIYLTEIPQNYFKVTSGLGEATPTALLFLPLLLNNEVQGVLEIASFRTFLPHEIEFMRRIAESMASSIANLRVNEHTKLLLQQSMQQAEELRAQEEEMRQNMEELAATQEEMMRKEGEMQKVLEDALLREEQMKELNTRHKREVESLKSIIIKMEEQIEKLKKA